MQASKEAKRGNGSVPWPGVFHPLEVAPLETTDHLESFCDECKKFLAAYALCVISSLPRSSDYEKRRSGVGPLWWNVSMAGAFFSCELSPMLTTLQERLSWLKWGSTLFVALPVSEQSLHTLASIRPNEFQPIRSPALFLLLAQDTYDECSFKSHLESCSAGHLTLVTMDEESLLAAASVAGSPASTPSAAS